MNSPLPELLEMQDKGQKMLMITPEFAEDSTVVSRYVPPRMTPRAAQRANRLAVQRAAVGCAPGWFMSLIPAPDEQAWQETGAAIEIDMRVDGETIHIRTAWSVLETLLNQAEPRVRIDDLDAELVAALIETHLMSEVLALEGVLGVSCAIERVAKVRDHGTLAHLDGRFFIAGSSHPYPASVFATPSILGMFATAWERSPRISAMDLGPSIVCAARVAVSSVSRNGLKGLAVGDALLFDRVAPDGGVVLCIAEHLTTVGQLNDSGDVTVGAPFTVQSPYLLGEFQMADNEFEAESREAALDETSIGNLPVRLVFELGRREMSIEELRNIGVGGSIALDKPASSIVDILANGRRVGAGEMVLIGDQLGVKITRLNGHA